MMRLSDQWHIVRRSSPCKVANSAGVFTMLGYSLIDNHQQERVLCVLRTSVLNNGALLRINSGCMTSEIFGDNSCDCAWQLEYSLKAIAENGNGLVIYAAFEEGRGAGLIEKLNTMALMQTTGCSSSHAFRELGLAVDTRQYGYASVIVRDLGLTEVTCLTNNPRKLACLREGGIVIKARHEIIATHRPELADFLADKVEHQGHTISLF